MSANDTTTPALPPKSQARHVIELIADWYEGDGELSRAAVARRSADSDLLDVIRGVLCDLANTQAAYMNEKGNGRQLDEIARLKEELKTTKSPQADVVAALNKKLIAANEEIDRLRGVLPAEQAVREALAQQAPLDRKYTHSELIEHGERERAVGYREAAELRVAAQPSQSAVELAQECKPWCGSDHCLGGCGNVTSLASLAQPGPAGDERASWAKPMSVQETWAASTPAPAVSAEPVAYKAMRTGRFYDADEAHRLWPTEHDRVMAGLAPLVHPAPTSPAEPSKVEAITDDDLRRMWRAAGGNFHGPIVETGVMPEASLLPFLRSLYTHPKAEPAGVAEAEEFVRMLLWAALPECCGRPVIGAEFGGMQETVCCGCPEPAYMSDAQIVASLRERFPESAAPAAPQGKEADRG